MRGVPRARVRAMDWAFIFGDVKIGKLSIGLFV